LNWHLSRLFSRAFVFESIYLVPIYAYLFLLNFLIHLFIYFFGGTGIWTQGFCACKTGFLPLESHVHLTLIIFGDGGLTNYLPGLASNHNPPDLSCPRSQDADMSHLTSTWPCLTVRSMIELINSCNCLNYSLEFISFCKICASVLIQSYTTQQYFGQWQTPYKWWCLCYPCLTPMLEVGLGHGFGAILIIGVLESKKALWGSTWENAYLKTVISQTKNKRECVGTGNTFGMTNIHINDRESVINCQWREEKR
jgi:hypothetical protein